MNHSQEYLLAMQDKHKRANNIIGKKVILAGGSNLVFGVDSKEIENALHMPVVNLGLHAQLGLSFILNEVKDIAQPHDLIVLSIEHLMTTEGNAELKKLTSYYNPGAYQYYYQEEKGWLIHIKKQMNSYQMLYKNRVASVFQKKQYDPIYNRSAFNQYGDGINHLEAAPKELGSKGRLHEKKMDVIHLLNAFYQFAQKKGIHVVFSYGAYEQSEYQKNESVVRINHQKLKEHLDMELIMEVDDFVYPDSHFYDSVYHLNKIGRALHTQRLIEKLKNSTTLTHLQKQHQQ